MLAKSTLGRILGGAILILALSPKAREVARQFAIRGTEIVLDVTDQIREAAAGMKSQIQPEHKANIIMDDLSTSPSDTINMAEH